MVVEVVAVVVLVMVAVVVVVVSSSCSSRRRDRPRRVVVGSSSHFRHQHVTRGGTSSRSPARPVHCAEELASSTDELWLTPRRGWLGG